MPWVATGRWRHLRRKSIPHSDYLFKTGTHWRLRAEAMRTLAEDAQDFEGKGDDASDRSRLRPARWEHG